MYIDGMLATKDLKAVMAKDTLAIVIGIIRLLILTPGENQSHPEMGVGLISNQRYKFKEDLKELELLIRDQISTYLPIGDKVDLRLSFNDDDTLIIFMDIMGLSLDLQVFDNNITINSIDESK